MFQDFSDPPSDAGEPARIEALRQILKDHNVDGFIIPRADEYQGEYVPPSAERLAWLTGFTGSAGVAVVMKDKAAIFIDGRYTLQVRDQVAVDVIEPQDLIENPPAKWIENTLSKGTRLGFDPRLHTIESVKRLKTSAEKAGAELVETANLVDAIWDDQPAPPKALLEVHPLQYAGETTENKLTAFRQKLAEKNVNAFLLTEPQSICWLLNIRGNDVPHTPLVLGFLFVPVEGKPTYFLDAEKVSGDAETYLNEQVDISSPETLDDFLKNVSGRVGLDGSHAGHNIASALQEAEIILMDDPCVLPKARKNNVELKGSRISHIRDGVAVTRFLAKISRTPTGTLTEIEAAKMLEDCRIEEGEKAQMPLRDLSFDTISGFGPNGAIVHYRVTEATNRQFTPDTLYLVDSGGQYQDGTTDITRTIAIGKPSHEMRRHFTLVLKGMIAISCLKFPKGTFGAQLDAFARVALWQAGLDYDHGTGHGVGSFLSVHEGPQRISKISKIPLEPGMILSNEPGYYKTDAYGIRIENLIVVTDAEVPEGGERPMMGFETLTFAPIDRTLIDENLLDQKELDWMNDYHKQVFEKLSPNIENDDDFDWLKAATAPL